MWFSDFLVTLQVDKVKSIRLISEVFFLLKPGLNLGSLPTGLRFVGGLLQGAGEGNGTPLQYSCLENPMDGGAWWAAVRGVARSRTRLSDFTFPFHFHALEKEMATHSSVLAWRIPGTGEPGGLPSMGSQRARHYCSDLAAAAAATGGTAWKQGR